MGKCKKPQSEVRLKQCLYGLCANLLRKARFIINPNLDYTKNPDYIFAALKFIEQLYIDKKISQNTFKNILKEYSDIVETSAFAADI